jgi:prevent-host-death family protein
MGQNGQKFLDDSFGGVMRSMSAKDAKYGFGRLIDTARAEPVTVEKHGRAVVVVLSIEEYERLRSIELEQRPETHRSNEKK